jgi:hypothetical protein
VQTARGAAAAAGAESNSAVVGTTVFSGVAWVGGQWQSTECREFPHEYRVRVGSGPDVAVARPTGELTWVEPRAAGADGIEATVAGPATILSNALRGNFCLHSSANQGPRGVIAFVGASGRGKSTLAGLLAETGWPQLADDILPLRLDGAAVRLEARSSDRLAAVYLLAERATTAKRRRLRGSEAMRTLLEQSIGPRLFGPDLLYAHFDFCSRFAALVPVYQLDYPRRRDIGASLRTLLATDTGLGEGPDPC